MTPGTGMDRLTPTAVSPSSWKRLMLRLQKNRGDGTADVVMVDILQPAYWISKFSAQVGAKVPIPPDLEELGLTDDPDARFDVMAVGPCPPIRDGPGRVVIATPTHLNNYIFELEVEEITGHREILHPTGIHRFWSEDRNRWVRTDKLQPGEHLRGRCAPVTVISTRQHFGVDRVYNLTVEGEHVYFVSGVDLLTHNAGSSPAGIEYEIVDGVRRAKAAELCGKPVIRAKIIGADGRQIGPVTDVGVDTLGSPSKPSIDVSTGPKMDRFMETLGKTKQGSIPPPIEVTPGNRGPKIRDVTLDLHGGG